MSDSKKKGCNPLIAILIIGCLLIVLLVASLFAGKSFLTNWLQGDGFRDWVRQKAAVTLKADVAIDEVAWSGMNANVGSVEGRGYKEAAFAKFQLDGIRANFNKGIKDRAFDVEEVNISQAEIEFSDDRVIGEALAKASLEDGASSKKGMPAWLANKTPNRVTIRDVVIGHTTIRIKDEAGKTAAEVVGVRAQVKPNFDTGQFDIHAREGRLKLPKAPQIDIREAQLRFVDQSLFIEDISLGVYDGGHIGGDGEIAFADSPDIDLNLELSQIALEKVLPEEWKSKVTGIARGPVKIKGSPDALEIKGKLHLDGGVLQGIPVLGTIAKYTKTDQFTRLILSQAEADFTQSGETLLLRNIKLESDGLTKIEGQLDKNGIQLNGALNIGVAPRALKWIPGAQNDVFTENRDGLVWTTVNIRGTTAKINEDLTDRLIEAAAIGIVEKIPGDVANKVRGLLGGDKGDPDKPNTGEGKLRDQIGDMIDGDGELIKKGKKLIDSIFSR